MRVPALFSLLALLAACATRPMPPPRAGGDVGRSVEQPFRDLSLIREVAPDVLLRAAANPYAAQDVATCPALASELRALDTALGADVDVAAAPRSGAESLAADLVAGAIGLPFRGMVRRVTGAERRDRALRAAVLAGMVRRGFVKGRMGLMACPR